MPGLVGSFEIAQHFDHVIQKRGEKLVERSMMAIVDCDVELVAFDFNGGVSGN